MALSTCANSHCVAAHGCSRASQCHERVTTFCKVAAAAFRPPSCACT
jgi:hypothetical protein